MKKTVRNEGVETRKHQETAARDDQLAEAPASVGLGQGKVREIMAKLRLQYGRMFADLAM